MEKVILALRGDEDDDWCARVRGPVAAELLDLDLPGLTVNVKDDAVRASLMTLTTLAPPVTGLVTIWTEQCYGPAVAAAIDRLRGVCRDVSGYLVTESVPLAPPWTEPGQRTRGLANVALLRRPPGLDAETWRTRWHRDHTPVAIATQATFGYVQNAVVRPLTADAPALDAIVEELFPIEAVGSLRAFFGAVDDEDLGERMAAMVASTAAFGANENIDTVPTSRYVLRSPFAGNR
ncbi:EthD domain-containing protein [Mycolicibacterium palauense]|uniref:EthD domain-containing protein n=1 Tax=Mycolicibacterium palauense TaxID=2034511 RepID=UPI000BFF17C7|nr:EthD domain-containing protein [Mycolicibacterium palauense]